MSIFKMYDIRGIYPEELNEDTAYKVGRAYADLLYRESKKEHLTIVVARDMRLSGETLAKAVVHGLRDGGVQVVYIGLASTPTFYFAVAEYGYDGGIIVSASHNPKEYNGFKMVRARAVPISGDTGIKDIERMVGAGDFESRARGEYEEKHGVLERQIAHDLQYADISKIKPLKVVADTANAMGSLYLDALFQHLPCELIRVNFELDGTFPVHPADPLVPENNAGLLKKILEVKADFGIAVDGDGDRIFFATEKGEMIEPGIVRGILARIFLREKPGSKIAYDVRPGKITPDMIVENGGTPVLTRVGHSLIKEQSIKEGVYFAGESSGHTFLDVKNGFYEVPVIATLKLLEEFSQFSGAVSEYVQPLQKYCHSGEINSKVGSVPEVLERIAGRYKDGTVTKLDGVSIEFDDYWFNVRGSNTEPLIRLNLEARTPDLMEEKRDEVLAVIRGTQ